MVKTKALTLVEQKLRLDAAITERVAILRSEIEARQEELDALTGGLKTIEQPETLPVRGTAPIEPRASKLREELGEMPAFLRRAV